MKAIHPKVSIIVPCYNQAQFLDEALQSVLDQTYTNWECIIVNDGSPDHTEEVAQKWAAKEARFVYLKKENGGVSSARNAGIEKAKGDFIQFLDSDDCIDNRKLELSLQELNSTISTDTKVAITNFRRFAQCDSAQRLLRWSSHSNKCVQRQNYFWNEGHYPIIGQ